MLLIEVGGHDDSDSLRYYNNGYKVFTFEPQQNLYEALRAKTSNLVNYTVIQKAVCLTDGNTTFNICKRGGASSILPFRTDDELARTWTANRTDIQYSGQSYNVETTRLDTFIEQNGLQNETIDFIHIDAQGVDLECLMSLGMYIKNVKAGVLETVIDKNKSIYIGQNLNTFNNTDKFLEDNNFTITNIEQNDITQCEFNIYFKSKYIK
jgi:FkbM family methyltransferase